MFTRFWILSWQNVILRTILTINENQGRGDKKSGVTFPSPGCGWWWKPYPGGVGFSSTHIMRSTLITTFQNNYIHLDITHFILLRLCSLQNLKSININVLKDEFVYGCLKDEEVIAQVMVEWNNFQNILNTTLLSIFYVSHDTRIWSE